MSGNRTREFQNSGFSNDDKSRKIRLLNRDGTYNIKKQGVAWLSQFSFFHFLINTSWTMFFSSTILYYILINAIFGGAYYVAGLEEIRGIDYDSGVHPYFQLCFFSSHTLTSVGYGNIHPIGMSAQVISFFEGFIGAISFALITGLFFAKISKPHIRINFSENAIISPHNGGKALMFRLVNGMNSILNESQVFVMLSFVDESGKRRFYQLNLEIDKIYMFVISWTVVHPITDDSPFKDIDLGNINSLDGEIVIQLKAFDETYSQEIMARYSYTFDEVIYNATYISMHDLDDEGNAIVNMHDINKYEKHN